jgi:choline dehydrogenase-like flavoprotein
MQVHDVVVIGSGAGGGTVTKVLADLGISVLLMEAGPMLSMSDLKEHMLPHHIPHRGAGPKGEAYSGRPTGFTYSATFGGAQLEGEPYTVAPGSDFSWFRSRILGGRTNHYGRVTLRFADYDFKGRSIDASASIGRSRTRTLRRTTTRPKPSSASSAPPRTSAARRTASFTRLRRCARTTRSCSARAPSWASAPCPRVRPSSPKLPTAGRPATTAASADAAA